MIRFVKDRPGHDRRYAIDNTKITTELGWEPRYTFEQGIKETINWYLSNNEWLNKCKLPLMKSKYIHEREKYVSKIIELCKAHQLNVFKDASLRVIEQCICSMSINFICCFGFSTNAS